MLSDYPREMWDGPTANLVSGHLVACYENSCEFFNGGEWTHLVNTRFSRSSHSSAQNDDRILLIGGHDSRSTEWISVDGSPSQPGPFHVRHGHAHCTIQVSEDIIVVTGGFQTWKYVTEYNMTGDGKETHLTPMGGGRYRHACAAYQDADGQQVNRVCNYICTHSILNGDEGF